jgi:hypothetical protein
VRVHVHVCTPGLVLWGVPERVSQRRGRQHRCPPWPRFWPGVSGGLYVLRGSADQAGCLRACRRSASTHYFRRRASCILALPARSQFVGLRWRQRNHHVRLRVFVFLLDRTGNARRTTSCTNRLTEDGLVTSSPPLETDFSHRAAGHIGAGADGSSTISVPANALQSAEIAAWTW